MNQTTPSIPGGKAHAITRHFHPLNPSLTTNDYTKSIYLNLLTGYPVEDVIAFFEAHPMWWEGRKLTVVEVLERLWSDKAKVPMAWDYGVGEALDRFLAERGDSIIVFYRKLLYRNNKSTYVPGRFLLKWFYPVLKMVFNSVDPRDMAIRLIPYFTENLLPHHIHRRIKRTIRGKRTESILVYISDDRFQEPIHFDSEVHSCEQIKASPGIIGLPPYEEVGILAESRPIFKAIWAGSIRESEGTISLDGDRIGKRIPFSEFTRSLDIDLSPFRVPNGDCVLLEKDIHCSIRNRIVARAGCAYGAPVYLQFIRHRNDVAYSGELLNPMVADWDSDEAPLALSAKEKHLAALRLSRGRLALLWHPADESITVNGEYLVKGVPARILKRLLSTYLTEGRTKFEYREFKRDDDIGNGQKNSNFEVRFYRLIERLNAQCPGLSISKTGRGRFCLNAKGDLTFKEAD